MGPSSPAPASGLHNHGQHRITNELEACQRVRGRCYAPRVRHGRAPCHRPVAYRHADHHTGETDEMLAAAPLFYHGSNGNGDTTAADMADIAKIGMLFKEMKGKTDMYLENQTLIAYTKQEIKNKKLAKAIEKAFPDAIPKSQWKGIMEGTASGSGSGSR